MSTADNRLEEIDAEVRCRFMEIIYTQAERTETLVSSAALRKILGRFCRRRVFYEMSSRDKSGNVFYSVKNTFVVGSIDVMNVAELNITVFDAERSAHSIEILNPALMRVYEEDGGKSFAVAFVSETAAGLETRCYLRDDGPADDIVEARTELGKLSLPDLFGYLEQITTADALGDTMPTFAPAFAANFSLPR